MSGGQVEHGEVRMLIGGELGHGADGAQFANLNPADETVLGYTSDASPADFDRAIAAARNAFDNTEWRNDHKLRAQCLRQLHEAVVSEREALRAELIAEAGAPVLMTTMAQLDWPLAENFLYPAELIDQFPWVRDLPDGTLMGLNSRRRVTKEAVGVVAAIVPWNFPFEVTSSKIAQALATGNTVILKPSPDTPWNATRLGRLVVEHTDIPPGVFNVVPCSNNKVAEILLTDPRIDMVSFTGSTAVGKHIVELSAPTLKRTFLELGGKSAMVALPDADAATVAATASFMMMHSGQGCGLTMRILLPQSRYGELVDAVTDAVKLVPYGDPTDPATIAGPLINQRQHDRVLNYIESGRLQGAKITVGGGRPAHLDKGFYVEPTVFRDVDNSMKIAREEIFGPVLTAIPYRDIDDAVSIANDSEYGLAGAVLSENPDAASRVAQRIRAGSIMINGAMSYGADCPFGGYKQSGIGRQNGVEGFEQYLETKAIATPQ
jgi:aldehyde dehydrogenase (NAD+)